MNPFRWSFRASFAFLALVCCGLLAFAYYSQFQMNLEPCPLCIMQRVAFIAFVLVALVAAAHGPKGWGRIVYGLLGLLALTAGAGVAGRHVWLQHLPPDQVPACGPGLGYMLENLALADALKKAFTGSGECAKVDWTFLGLSMPEWTLAWFVGLAIVVLWLTFRREPRKA
ncbi:MAG TPA: disulfide bond formation protein B [Xanthomonadales bacterium]|nr:disulfide bond formation protein B [Xanthomonadales bacterium]